MLVVGFGRHGLPPGNQGTLFGQGLAEPCPKAACKALKIADAGGKGDLAAAQVRIMPVGKVCGDAVLPRPADLVRDCAACVLKYLVQAADRSGGAR